MNTDKPRSLRGARGLRQEDVHTIVGLSLNGYRAKERGDRRWYFDEIEALAKFYGVSVLAFTDQNEEEK